METIAGGKPQTFILYAKNTAIAKNEKRNRVNAMLLIYYLSLHFEGLKAHYPRYNPQLFQQS